MLALLTVTTNQDVVDFNDGVLSLREAIFVANTVAGPDTIEFDFGHDGPETIVLTQGELVITDSLVIDGFDANLLTIDASGTDPTPDENNGDGSRVFLIDDGNIDNIIDVSISGVTITGGDAPGDGGGILSEKRLSLTDTIVVDNHATGSGGIRQFRGTLALVRSEVTSNSGNQGGGVSVQNATLDIQDSTISQNTGQGSGGGISVHSNSIVSIARSTITNNTDVIGGAGGIWARDVQLTIVDSSIDDNTAGGRGGGMEVLGNSSFTMIDSSVSRNHAAGGVTNAAVPTLGGGGLFVNFANVSEANSEWVIRGSTIADNTADFDGGGIYVVNSNTIQGYGTPNSPARLRIEESYITGNTAGRDGGGIFAFDVELVVEDSVIANNSALGTIPINALDVGRGGGLFASQTSNVQVRRTVVRDNTARRDGGGLAATPAAAVLPAGAQRTASLSVLDSVVEGNTSGESGGGIYIRSRPSLGVASVHSIANSTISGNIAEEDGGGIYAVGVSGGPDNSQLQLQQATISGNRARGDGGGLMVRGNAKIGHSTIAYNIADSDGDGAGDFGGIAVGQLFMDHTIVARNIRGDEASDGGGAYFESGYNLVANIPAGQTLPGPGNIVGEDPLLGPLADNGGPTFLDGSRMRTHTLMAGSPAIDAGDPAAEAGMDGVPEFDQRSEPFARVLDGDEPDDIAIDIGAYEREFGETYTFVVDTLVDESDGDYSLGDFSLREAIELANANPGADAIEFDPALWAAGPATILLTMGELQITDSLMIEGPGAELLTIDASGNDPTPGMHNYDGTRAINIIGGGSASATGTRVSGLAFTGGDTVGGGGAIRSIGNSYFDRLFVWGNHAADGGGIHVSQAGVVEITNSYIKENYAGSRGGGIELSNSIGFIRQSTIVENRSGAIGGGLSVILADVLVENSTISGNQASSSGGGVFNRSSSLEVRHSTVVYNQIDATGSGSEIGGIDSRLSSNFSVSHTIVAGNTKVGNPSDVSSNATLQYSLIGFGNGLTEAPIGSADANGNLIGGPVNGLIDPMLGPLVNNGGPSRTHALLPGSPAIDAGDPLAVAGMEGVPTFDQRGMPWWRVANGDDVPEARIDMGAVEWQVNPLPGDYNFNGRVDAADYSVWRDTLGSTTDLRADGSSESTPGAPDGVVDEFDYAWWKANFGSTLQFGSGAVGAGSFEQVAGSTEQGAIVAGQASSGTPIAGELRLAGDAVAEASSVGDASGGAASVGFVVIDLSAEDARPARRSSPARGWRSVVGGLVRDAALLAWVNRRDRAVQDEQAEAMAPFDADEVGPGGSKLDAAFAELGGGLGW